MSQDTSTHLDKTEGEWRKVAETQIQILSCGEITKGLECQIKIVETLSHRQSRTTKHFL